jgi:3-hydroxybenzoate 6-monooxygenase
MTLPILIAGGGIGGLATAMGLAQKGIKSLVLERAAELGEIGAGIQLGPNAFQAFDYLGVGDTARKMAVYVDALIMMDAMTGEPIINVPLDEPFRKRFKNPYAVIHRGDLHGVFLKACKANPLVELRTSHEVVGYELKSETATAILKDGRKIEGAALIGADGLMSRIRAQLVGDGAPRVTGHTTYRSVIPAAEMPESLRWNAAALWAGPKCHLVHYPLSDSKTFNLVITCHNAAMEPVAGKPVSHDEVMKGFAHIAPVARQIIEIGKDWKLWVLCDRDPTLKWVDGRVALLGDAAHPTLQYMAQGACMAMEDAVCLAHEMGQTPGDIPTVLEAYRRKRIHRTARVQIQSRMIGDHVYHPDGGHAALRNAMMRGMTTEQYYDSFQWLYGGSGLVEGASAVI